MSEDIEPAPRPENNPERNEPRISRYVIVSSVLFILLIGATGWLLYQFDQLQKRTIFLETRIAALEKTTDALSGDMLNSAQNISYLDSKTSTNAWNISSLASDLNRVSRIANNANNFAHSHYSDAHLKTDIIPLENALSSLATINAVRFNWKATTSPLSDDSSPSEIGLIAQEVERIYPELVDTGPNGYLTIDYSRLVPILLQAIKEQQAAIERLESRLDSLENSFMVSEPR